MLPSSPETALAERTRQLDAALAHMAHGLVMTDAAERVLLCNDRFLSLYGLPRSILRPGLTMAELIAQGVAAGHFPGETVETVVAARARRLAGGAAAILEQRLSDGRIVEVHFRPVAGGGWVMLYEEVTERRRSEEALREQTARFDTTLEALPVGICMFDGDQKLVVCNARYLDLFGLPRELARPGTSLRAILDFRVTVGQYAGADPATFVAERLQAARATEPAAVDLHMRDGRVLALVQRPMPGGGWVATFDDVTERAAAERERVEQGRRFDTALESMPAGLCLFDAEERLAVWNRRYGELYGLQEAQLYRGMPYRELLELGVGLGRHAAGRTVEEIRGERLAMVRGERAAVTHQILADGRIVEIALRAAAADGWVATYQDVTERRRAEESLVEQNLRFDAALAHMSHGLIMVDGDDRVVLVNRKFRDFYGLSSDDARPGVPMRHVVERSAAAGNFPGLSLDAVLEMRRERLANGKATSFRHALPCGRILEIHFSPLADGRGWVTIYNDVTEQASADARVAEQNARFDAALNNMAEGLLMLDADLRLIVCNERYREILGLPEEVTGPGATLAEMIGYNVAIGRHGGRSLDDLMAERRAVFAGRQAATLQVTLSDGRIVETSYRPMEAGGWVATYTDVTARRQAEARVAHMARHDALTDLPNRLLFRERLLETLAGTAGGGTSAVLCLDLDRFKAVNDTLGHAVGDRLLCQVTQRLQRSVAGTDAVLARLGGDEFSMLLPGACPERASAVAKRLVEEVGRGYEIDGHQVEIGVSIGLAISPTDGDDPDQLMRSADIALYRAKAEGRGTHRFFERDMDARMLARRQLELDLRQAIAGGQLELHYQPLVTLDTGRISGFEALVRWHHPVRGLVGPGEFIPLAEEIGLIGPLGEWVLREACREAAAWPAEIRVAVNLSPVQFRNQALVLTIAAALGASGLDPRRLEVEITEGVLLQNTEATLAILHELKRLGVRIALDDFGTGYSSLSYLRAFPFDKIKIDRSFIADIASRADAVAIVRAVTSLGASLGMTTTAEGIETEEQLDRLRAEGCTEVQGYLLGRPQPASEVPATLSRRKRSRPHLRTAEAA